MELSLRSDNTQDEEDERVSTTGKDERIEMNEWINDFVIFIHV